MERTFCAGDVMFGVFYPRRYIVAVFDDRGSAEQALIALGNQPEIEEPGRLWSGEEALAYHKEHVEDRTSLIDRLAGFLVPDEAEILADYLTLARSGKVFMTVHVEGDEAIGIARRILAEHGAHTMRYYGDWTVRDLPGSKPNVVEAADH